MSHLLLYYQRPDPSTWVFLSSFLLVGLFFVFHRFWSLRNLDIVLLLLLAPGLMMVYEGRKMRIASHEVIPAERLVEKPTSTNILALHNNDVHYVSQLDNVSQLESTNALSEIAQEKPITNPGTGQRSAADAVVPKPKYDPKHLEFMGFLALLFACGLLTIRMMIDPLIVRRPLLEPNLSIGGLIFLGMSLLFFLLANVITSDPQNQKENSPKLGPGYALVNMLPDLPTTPDTETATWQQAQANAWLLNLARIIAIFANLAILFGIVGVGYWHFDNVKTGIGAATIYLLLPYTAQMTGNIQHALPAALLVLALLSYRVPMLAGLLLGAGAGLVYYPLFLLPLWTSFYWKRGLGRFLMGVMTSLVVLAGLLLLGGMGAFLTYLQQMFGLWLPMMEGLEGVWGNGFHPFYRLPVLVGFFILSASFAFFPARKTFGTLMCGTAAVMLAAQFWHGYGGGLYMAWFLPFVLLTIFRPNLDDRIATKVVRPNWYGPDRLAST